MFTSKPAPRPGFQLLYWLHYIKIRLSSKRVKPSTNTWGTSLSMTPYIIPSPTLSAAAAAPSRACKCFCLFTVQVAFREWTPCLHGGARYPPEGPCTRTVQVHCGCLELSAGRRRHSGGVAQLGAGTSRRTSVRGSSAVPPSVVGNNPYPPPGQHPLRCRREQWIPVQQSAVVGEGQIICFCQQ